ncbi:MAG: T9SS type A sorting domain-containing protein [Microscillaceae bacterium]|nr:T9SS type A sorting domain-containing protein [Microscillaceae bacterium]
MKTRRSILLKIYIFILILGVFGLGGFFKSSTKSAILEPNPQYFSKNSPPSYSGFEKINILNREQTNQTFIENDSITFEKYRAAYNNLMANHPYNHRPHLSYEEIRAIPKRDRPDLPMEQNYLMTMDPYLGYVPSDRGLKAFLENWEAQKNTNYTVENQAAHIQWTEKGPNNVAGRTRTLMFDPNDPNHQKVWAGGVAGGLWYNLNITDQASPWIRLDDFWANIAITTIAFDPHNTQIFYVGTGEGFFNVDAVRGGGIWKTKDGGLNWEHLDNTTPGPEFSLSDFAYIQKIVVDPQGIVYAATRGDLPNRGGIMKSTDRGKSWTKVLAPRFKNQLGGFFYDWAADIEIAANGDLFASFGLNFTEGRIFRSTDKGQNWQNITPNIGGNRIELAVASTNNISHASTILYAVAGGGLGSKDVKWMYKSENGGDSWQSLNIPLMIDGSGNHFTRGHAYYDLILNVHPQNPQIIFAGGIDIHKSMDGGQSWEGLSHWQGRFSKNYMHADQHQIIFRPDNSLDMIFANDGGVYYSTDAAVDSQPTFQPRNQDYNVTQFYSVAIDNVQKSEFLLGGTQDNGTQRFDSQGFESTEEVLEGDGAFTFIDRDNPNFVIASRFYNTYYRSFDGGINFDQVAGFQSKGRPINPCDYDSRYNILYAAGSGNELMRYSNFFGQVITTSLLTDAFDGALISSIKVSPYNPDRLFIGTDRGQIFRVENARSTPIFQNITHDIQALGYIVSIDIGASDEELLLAFSNYGVQSVWYTQDGGLHWQSKDKPAYRLPDMPVRWVLFNPSNYQEVMLATELGVWYTSNITNQDISWQNANQGLANVRCDMLTVRPADKRVAVATHGRGVFITDAWNDLPTTPEILIDRVLLINTETQQIITEIKEGDVIEIDLTKITQPGIKVETDPDTIGSLDISLSGAFAHRQTENHLPYSLFGDQFHTKRILGRALPMGNYKLSVVPYSDAKLAGAVSPDFSVNFSLKEYKPIEVKNFKLIDATTQTEIMALEDGAIIDLYSLQNNNLSILAETGPTQPGSISFDLQGAFNSFKTENSAPYTLFGEEKTLIKGREFCPGIYTLEAIPYKASQRQGLSGTPLKITFTLLGNLFVESLTLIDTQNDTDIQNLDPDSENIITFSGATAELSIRANTPCSKSVQFVLQDQAGNVLYQNVENELPFALFADKNKKDYLPGNLSEGYYVLLVKPYSEPNTQGNEGQSMSLSFELRPDNLTLNTMNRTENLHASEIQLIDMYPNPVEDEMLHLEFLQEIEQNVRVEISDYLGNIAYQSIDPIKVKSHQLQIDLSALNLQNGNYLLKIYMQNSIHSTSTVIIRQFIKR